MGKSEKLVVLSVLFIVVSLFVWSLQSDGTSKGAGGSGEVYAGERDLNSSAPMDQRAPRGPNATVGAAGASSEKTVPVASATTSEGHLAAAGTAGGGGADTPSTTKMLLAETGIGSSVEFDSARKRRTGKSTLADRAAGGEGATPAAESRTGLSRAQPHMQPGWDLVTTAGLQSTVDPAMFLYKVTGDAATWASLAKDLYGDKGKAALLRHNNEGMATPKGSIFVPAKDELGREAAMRTVEVLHGESLWQVAKRTLGKGTEWKAVYNANRDVITDPDFVAPGTVLRIPIR